MSFASLSAILKWPFAGTSLPVAAASVGGVADPTLVESFGNAPAVPPNALVGAAAISPNARTGYVVTSVAGQTEPGDSDNLLPSIVASRPFPPGVPARPVGIASTPDGQGNWLAGVDGGVFSFGDARFSGRRVVCG